MSRTWAARSEKSSRSRSCLPKSFTTSAPATLNRSAIVLLIDAFRLKPSRVITCSFRPMRRAGMMNAGSTTRVRSVSRHSRPNITASVIPRVIAFWTTVPMVLVTACCAPMTSLLIRLIERAGLDPGEERDREPLHVVEQRDPHVVDQALTDPGRVPALQEAEHRVGDGDAHGGEREAEDERSRSWSRRCR